MESRKTQYTKSVIRESFLSLLREKPVEKITVTELCAKADINRSTFYAHYLDVYDLKEKLEQSFFEEMSAVFHRTEWDSFMLDMALALQKNDHFCQALFGEYGDREFLRRCVSGWMAPMQMHLETPQENWRFLFVANGAAAVTGDWILRGMKEPPEEIAHALERLCDSVNAAGL